jgi:hypothetical protein
VSLNTGLSATQKKYSQKESKSKAKGFTKFTAIPFGYYYTIEPLKGSISPESTEEKEVLVDGYY